MLTQNQMAEMKLKLESRSDLPPELRDDITLLLTEVEHQQRAHQQFTARVEMQLNALEKDFELIDADNARLRTVADSAFFERDACIGLISKMANCLNIPVGTGKFEVTQENRDGKIEAQTQNRVIVDLPSGQVSWDYLDSEAHLFENLPPYDQSLQPQDVREIYSKIMNPGL